MSQKIDPSFNQMLNENKGTITPVVHVPKLPLPSSLYEHVVFYLKTDGRFYHCILIDNQDWTWESVTEGVEKHFVMPVCWLDPEDEEFVFNDSVNTIRKIIAYSNRHYGTTFENLPEDGTVEMIEAITKFNELRKYFNKECNITGTDEEIKEATADETHPSFAVKINQLCSAVNPVAPVLYKRELKSLLRCIAGIEPSNPTAALTALKNKAAAILEGGF